MIDPAVIAITRGRLPERTADGLARASGGRLAPAG